MISDNHVLDVALFLAILIPCVILHEVAHGWVAERLGDPTARLAGRLTLNPIRHLDFFGSLLFPAVLAAAGQSVWGWARPVPVNPAHFRRPSEGMAAVALAGPATNLTLAVVAARLGPLVDLGREGSAAALLSGGGVFWPSIGIGVSTGALWGRVVFAFVLVNCALAALNMLPIPPLDGSRLVPLVLPQRWREGFNRLAPYGFLVLFAFLMFAKGALNPVVGWLMRVVV